jgi:N6-adenosine-specific RNA methylase IME4
LPIAQLADDDCHAYLWFTRRALLAGYTGGLLEGWGFTVKEVLVWAKPSIGLGHPYFRNQTEMILFGVKGSLPIKRRDLSNLIDGRRGSREHSAKPAEFYDLVEAASPGPYLELFGRGQPRPGWVSWGEDGVVVGPDKMIVSEADPPLSDDLNERPDVSSI